MRSSCCGQVVLIHPDPMRRIFEWAEMEMVIQPGHEMDVKWAFHDLNGIEML